MPDCVNKTVEHCTPVTDLVCNDVPIIVNETVVDDICVNVPDKNCETVKRKTCQTVNVTVVVPGYKLDCKPVGRQVCTEVSKTVCEEVPNKVCKEISATKMTWVTAQECEKSYRCKRSFFPKYTFGTCDGSWCSPQQQLCEYKCWPVQRWESVPVWKTVCEEEWLNVCKEVWEPRCETVWEDSCVKIPVSIDRFVPRVECTDVAELVCTPFERQECNLVERVILVEKFEVVCDNVTTNACQQVPAKVAGRR